jgi:hypothetical protein
MCIINDVGLLRLYMFVSLLRQDRGSQFWLSVFLAGPGNMLRSNKT